jgi:transglutaminase-like putative cysteine protease
MNRTLPLLLLAVTLAAARAAALAIPAALEFAPLPADAPILQQAAAADTNRFPNADTVIVAELVRETYQPDGTSVCIADEYVKVLTEKGRRESTVHSLYLPTAYGTAQVLRAEIIRPDGSRTTVDPARQGRVMVDPGQMGSNIYDPNNKLFQLSIPGLAIDDIVHLTALHTTYKARVPDTWADFYTLEGTSPILSYVYELAAPTNRPLHHRYLRSPVSNTVSYTATPLPDGRLLHRWTAREVPQIFPEPEMPAAHTVVQRVLLSTAPDWPAISSWYYRLCQPRLETVTPEMHAMVSNLVAGVAGREERIRAVFKFVSQDIRYMGITTENVAPGYEPHDVSMTFSNRYGVCRDKAALLVALLRLAGFEAYPVLIMVGAKLDPECPVPYFNHAIVAVVRPEGGYQLMDPTNENTRDLFPGYLCNRSYLVAHPTGDVLRVSEVPPTAKQLVRIRSRGTLDENSTLALETTIAFDGINDTAYRGHFLRLKPEERRRYFEGLLKGRLAGAELTSFRLLPEALQNTAEPLCATLSCRVKDYPVRGSGVTLLNLPWLGTSLGYVNMLLDSASLEKRRYPYVTELACGAEERIEVTVARSALGAPRQLPPVTHLQHPGVEFHLATALTNQTLTGELRFLLTQPEFTPAEYTDLKQVMRDMEFAARHTPLFAPAGGGEPDVRILSDHTRLTLTASNAWSSTRTIVRQILTYAGKKRFAELKIPFNPVWQEVDVVEATVSNRNGTVRSVTPQEINRMDAPWVAGAPRYPAARIQVISLPGVEIGSVIRTTVTRTQRDAAFFALEHPFGGLEPVESMSLELSAPAALPLRLDTRHNRGELVHTCHTNQGMVTWRWEAGPLAATPPEDALPPWPAFRPTVLASAGSWDAYGAAWQQTLARTTQATPELRARVAALTRACRTPAERLQAIRDEVAIAIREDGPSFLELPLATLSPAARTLADGYGHDADRAILLTTLLREAGFSATPLLVSGVPRLTPALLDPFLATPQLNLFDQLLVRTTLEGREIYLNDSDQYGELGTTPHQRHPALALDGTTNRVLVAPALRDRERTDWIIALEGNGDATLTVTNWYYGSQCGAFRKEYEEMPPEERRRHFQGLVAEISQAAVATGELVTATTGYPGYRAFQVRAARYAVREQGTLTLQLPDPHLPLPSSRADQRIHPLLVNTPREWEWNGLIILPAGVRNVPVRPESAAYTLPEGNGEVATEVRQERLADGRLAIRIRHTVVITPAILPPHVYPALLEINRRLSHPGRRTVLAEF